MIRQHVTLLVAMSFGVFFSSTSFALDILAPGDPIVGIWQTVAGGNSTDSTIGTGEGQYPMNEPPSAAIDNSTATKYLNFGSAGNPGVNTGFYVTPSLPQATIVTGVTLATANDSSNRDPLSITIEGASGGDLSQGSSWSLIYNGPTGLSTDPGRLTFGPQQDFVNANAYTSYRVLVTSVRGAGQNSMQFSEIELHGTQVPEPSSLVLGALGLVGLACLGFRRRRRR